MGSRRPWHSWVSCSLLSGLLIACAAPAECGSASGIVRRVIDGDTIELESGERVRYLLVDAPESTNGHTDCFGAEASEINRRLVEGQRVTLRYGPECRDRYDRLLAYVSVAGREVNSLLVREGYACVLHIPPNGNDRAREFEALESAARRQSRGLWGACPANPCE